MGKVDWDAIALELDKTKAALNVVIQYLNSIIEVSSDMKKRCMEYIYGGSSAWR